MPLSSGLRGYRIQSRLSQVSAAYVQRGSLNFRSPCAILQLTGFAASGIFANEFSSCPESQVLVNQI